MPVFALGLNHATAPIEIRQRISVSSERLRRALNTLRTRPGVRAAAILSTCNRTDLYCRVDADSVQSVGEWFEIEHGLKRSVVASHLYQHHAADAVRHVMRVACGLDSLITGEPQILGQLKQAWHAARAAKSLDAVMERLLQRSFTVAKQVRTQTAIGASTVSVAYAAVQFTQRIFDDLTQRTALLIGAGDTIGLVSRYLNGLGIGRIVIANRSLENARHLAERCNALCTDLLGLGRWLESADIVVSSTASPQVLISCATMRQALSARRHRPIVMVDLAVPHDIDPNVETLDDVYLCTVDDLGEVITEGRQVRRDATAEAELIVDHHVSQFMDWVSSREATSAIRKVRHHGELLRDETLALAQRRLSGGDQPSEVLAFLAHTLTNKLLHTPTQSLREAGTTGCSERIRLVQSVFEHAAHTKLKRSDREATDDPVG